MKKTAEYYRFSMPEKPFEWCYSAKQLEAQLNGMLSGDRLKAIYVTGYDCLNSLTVKENCWDSYELPVRLEFDKTFADIRAHAEGLFEIRLFDSKEVGREHFFGEPKDDDAFCDIRDVFHPDPAGTVVKQVRVEATDDWMYNAKGFDKSKVSDPVELPAKIRFILDNGYRLTIIGCEDDYLIKMEEDAENQKPAEVIPSDKTRFPGDFGAETVKPTEASRWPNARLLEALDRIVSVLPADPNPESPAQQNYSCVRNELRRRMQANVENFTRLEMEMFTEINEETGLFDREEDIPSEIDSVESADAALDVLADMDDDLVFIGISAEEYMKTWNRLVRRKKKGQYFYNNEEDEDEEHLWL